MEVMAIRTVEVAEAVEVAAEADGVGAEGAEAGLERAAEVTHEQRVNEAKRNEQNIQSLRCCDVCIAQWRCTCPACIQPQMIRYIVQVDDTRTGRHWFKPRHRLQLSSAPFLTPIPSHRDSLLITRLLIL